VSGTLESLRRQIKNATELGEVVHTMKVIAASNVKHFENAAIASLNYFATIELGLTACLRDAPADVKTRASGPTCAIVFGTDQGLVGRFNETIADEVRRWASGQTIELIAVGRRLESALTRQGLSTLRTYGTANSLGAISPVVARILADLTEASSVWIFHNRPREGGGFTASSQRMLPLDAEWQSSLAKRKWPTNNLPEVFENDRTLRSLVSEYLYVSLFRACAESLASENAGRLEAMQRAESNIQDLLSEQERQFSQLRQSSIDEELFDVIAGFEAQSSRDGA